MRNAAIMLTAVSACILLSSCIGLATEGARATHSGIIRNQYLADALAGDAKAQYAVGKSYCCSPGGQSDGYYNTQKATEFLCLAAIQGYGPAALLLGKIHSGHRTEGVRLLKRAGVALAGDVNTDLTVATYWLTQAKLAGVNEAAELLEDFPKRDISHLHASQDVPCTMIQVYGE